MNHEQPTSYTLGHCQVYYPVATGLCYPVAQQADRREPLGRNEAQEGSRGRITVRITRCGTRLCDADNTAGGKLLIDQLRYQGLIPEDNPAIIYLELHQVKVPKDQIGTLVEIIYP